MEFMSYQEEIDSTQIHVLCQMVKSGMEKNKAGKVDRGFWQ